MNKINEIFKKYNGFISIILIGIIIFLMLPKFNKTSTTDKPYDDSLYIYKNKLGQLQYEKDIETLSKKELKEQNEKLYEIYKSFSNHKPNMVFNLKVENIDTTKKGTANTYKFEGGNLHSLSWGFTGKSYELKGVSYFRMKLDSTDKKNIKPIFSPDSTYLLSRKFELELNAGLVEEKGKKRLIVTPVDTTFKLKMLNAIEIDDNKKPEKKPLITLGIQTGYGISSNNNTFYHSPYIGVGVQYNLLTIYSRKK